MAGKRVLDYESELLERQRAFIESNSVSNRKSRKK